MSWIQEIIEAKATSLERIREAQEDLESMEGTLQSEYVNNWGDIPAGYTFTLTEIPEQKLKLVFSSYYSRVDYYKLVKRLPNGAQLCHHMADASTLKIEEKYYMGSVLAMEEEIVEGVLMLRAALPDPVKAKLRKANVIQDSFAAGSAYETVVCPGEVTADNDIPF